MLKTLLALTLCSFTVGSPAQDITDSTPVKHWPDQRVSGRQLPPLPSPHHGVQNQTVSDTILLEITDHFAVRGAISPIARVDRFDSTFIIQKIKVDTIYKRGVANARSFYVINSLPFAEDFQGEALYILKPSKAYWYRGGRKFQLPPRMQLFEIAKVHHPGSSDVVLKYPRRQKPENLDNPLHAQTSNKVLGITFPLFKPEWQRTFENVVIPDWEKVQGNL